MRSLLVALPKARQSFIAVNTAHLPDSCCMLCHWHQAPYRDSTLGINYLRPRDALCALTRSHDASTPLHCLGSSSVPVTLVPSSSPLITPQSSLPKKADRPRLVGRRHKRAPPRQLSATPCTSRARTTHQHIAGYALTGYRAILPSFVRFLYLLFARSLLSPFSYLATGHQTSPRGPVVDTHPQSLSLSLSLSRPLSTRA